MIRTLIVIACVLMGSSAFAQDRPTDTLNCTVPGPDIGPCPITTLGSVSLIKPPFTFRLPMTHVLIEIDPSNGQPELAVLSQNVDRSTTFFIVVPQHPTRSGFGGSIPRAGVCAEMGVPLGNVDPAYLVAHDVNRDGLTDWIEMRAVSPILNVIPSRPQTYEVGLYQVNPLRDCR